MRVKKFDIEFVYGKRKMTGSCQRYVSGISRYPLYWVHVPGGKWGEVYVFYLVDKKKRKFFWYKLHDSRDRVAAAIVKALKAFKETGKAVTIHNY